MGNVLFIILIASAILTAVVVAFRTQKRDTPPPVRDPSSPHQSGPAAGLGFTSNPDYSSGGGGDSGGGGGN